MYTLYFDPFFSLLLLISRFVPTEDINGIELRSIMNERHYLLANSIFYNEKNFRVFNVIEEVGTFIQLSKDMDIADDAAFSCSRIF
jgi:hypothetical protein